MFNRFSRKSFWVLLLLVGLIGSGAAFQNSDAFFQIKRNFTIFSEVYQEITLRYVDDVDPEKIIRRGIDAMLESLDPYTVLIDQSEAQSLEVLTRGSYAGVGIEVGARGGRLVIIAPIDGYSAQRKGIRAGDVILNIDDISVEGFSVDDIQSLIAGEPGSTVTLTIDRFGIDQPIRFELTREQIEIKNVLFYTYLDDENTIGYVALSRFGQNAAAEVRDAITRLKSQGNLNSLVLDLRNNPGGLLDEAVKMVDLFVGPGLEVVRTQGRGVESTFTARTEAPVFYGGPLIVVQNNGSASSSEIVAGALQDLDRAVLVGERSFGKGLVQVVRSLSYNTTLKITTSRYYIPSGRSIQSPEYNPEDPDESLQLPDSLRNAFTTRGGRTVYDGVGIDPDVRVGLPRPSLLETSLMRNNTYFFFANEYQSVHDAFDYQELPDSVFDEFLEYLQRSGFTYESRAHYHLSGIRAQMDSTDTHISEAIESLQNALTEQKLTEMQRYRESISRQLFLELVSRYHTDQQQAQTALNNDPVIRQVRELAQTPGEIAVVLGQL